MALKANESLLNGKYLIERVLGRGGFGFVYLARDTLIGRAVAIKEMNPALADDDQMVRRFLVEGRAALQLRHPNVVELYDVFSDRGYYYLAMEYCPGGSLDERLAAGPLTVNDALVIMDQVCAGLAHTHSRGIVHCDIKPANILFGADGQAKVTDFGIAHVSSTAVARSWGTSSGFAGGTLTYMAPEQLDGVRDDPRVDVYALGAMLYRMIAGGSYLDFRAEESISDQIHNALLIKQGTPVALGQRVRGIPAWLDRVVLQALSKQPSARYPDASALRAALQPTAAPARAAAAPAKTTILPPVRRPPAATPPPTPRPAARAAPAWLWMAGGGIGVLMLLAVTLAVVLSRDGNPAHTPTATRVALATATAKAAVSTNTPTAPVVVVTPSAASTTATAIEAATATPDGNPTSTIAPPPTTAAPPTRPPTPFGGGTVVASPTGPVPRTPAPLPAPVPSEPQENANVTGKIKFVWDYLGQLQPGQAFEVRIWAEGATEHLGAAPSVTTQETTIDLDWAPGIVAKEKEKGVYLWAVAVIEKATGARIGRESEPRHFRYSPGGCVGACRY